jgi:hypothetical protein
MSNSSGHTRADEAAGPLRSSAAAAAGRWWLLPLLPVLLLPAVKAPPHVPQTLPAGEDAHDCRAADAAAAAASAAALRWRARTEATNEAAGCSSPRRQAASRRR